MHRLILPVRAIHLILHITLLRARRLQITAIKVRGAILILLTLIRHPTIMEQRLPHTQQTRLRELCREPVLRQLLRGNVLRDFIGCPHQQDKQVGVWLTAEHTSVEDMAAMLLMGIRVTLLRHKPPEDIIAAVSLGILSARDALTALAREAIHGTDQNAYPLLPPAILEALATIIILPI